MAWYDDALSGFAGGGAIGGVLGAFGVGTGSPAADALNADRDRMNAFEREVAGRQVPLLGQAAQGGASDFRGDQRDLVSRLQALASGRGPSLAQEQLRQGVDRATSQQYAMAAGARGNAGLAQRNAMNAAGMLQSQAAGQGAMARAAEQLGALSQLGTASGQGRAMDDSMAQFNAGQSNQFSLANQAAQLESERMRDAARLQAMGAASQYGQQAMQQPNFWDKLGAFQQGIASTIRGGMGPSGMPQGAGGATPYYGPSGPVGNNTINPFQY